MSRKDKDKGSADMQRFYIVLGAVGVIGIGAVVWSLGSSALSSAVSEPVELEELSGADLVARAGGMERGDPNAPVTIVEFGDFQCPGCGQFAMQVKPLVDLNYVETGQVKFVFYDFPLTRVHPNAFLAARSARCAGDQDRFWQFHDQLFRNQGNWSAAANPTGKFMDYGEAIGLDVDVFESCVKSDRHADGVTASLRLGEQLGISGTPTILVRSGEGMATRLGSFGFASIAEAVDQLLAAVEEPVR